MQVPGKKFGILNFVTKHGLNLDTQAKYNLDTQTKYIWKWWSIYEMTNKYIFLEKLIL